MKKQIKKLVLAKETVRSLATFDLRDVAGGASISGTCNSCGVRFCQREPAC